MSGQGDDAAPPARRRSGRGRFLSPLTRRILAINLVAPVLLVAGLLYLDQYRAALIESRINALREQGELIAGALGEAAVTVGEGGPILDLDIGRQMVRRLVVTSTTRARLFATDGELIGDSRYLFAAGRGVALRSLPPPEIVSPGMRFARWVYAQVAQLFPAGANLPRYRELPVQRAENYVEATLALSGDPASAVRSTGGGAIVISVAVPVQGLRRVLGALMLSVDGREIDDRVRDERLNFLKLFALALIVTVLLSLFLAGTIASPVRRLARAADQIRTVRGRRVEIPDFGERRDEIGDLSVSLRDMTVAMYRRLDAIEAFAADVAHEIKNPLTSLRSAVESFARVQDPEKRQRLIAIIEDDVRRLDRLISDISNASRLDAELSRLEEEPVDLTRLLQTVAELHAEIREPQGPKLVLDLPPQASLVVRGIEGRLGQVVRNVIDNAISFSPPGGTIRLSAKREANVVVLTVDDEGPGIPDDKLLSVFDRFYTERPGGEPFGQHSGLGLSIARQIVEALGGTITAENRRDGGGRVLGARFTLKLPA